MALADEFAKGMMEGIGNISKQFPTIDKDALSKLVGPGGALSDTLGYSDPKELIGMTPEAFQQSMAMRTQIMKDTFGAVKDLSALSDMVSGNAETRQAMYQAMPQVFNAQMQEGMQGQRFAQDEKMEKEIRQPFEAKQKAMDRALEQQRIDIQRAEAANMASYRNQSLALQRKRLDLQSRELTKIQNAQSQNAELARKTFPANPSLYNAYESTKMKMTDSKSGKVLDQYRRSWVDLDMRQKAMGTPYGMAYKTLGYKDELGGYQYVMLFPTGWYGMNYDPATKQRSFSAAPVVSFSADYLPQKAARRESQGELVPRFDLTGFSIGEED